MTRGSTHALTRRGFLKATTAAAAACAAPTIIPSSVWGQDRPTPSNRITVATIGVRGQGGGVMGAFLGNADVQMVALCDVDAEPLMQRRDQVNNHYKNQDCKTYRDFREVLARDDIDAVIVGTPDHWHALITVAAAKSGKDVYCEKPMSHTFREGRAMCDAIQQYGRVFQVGSQQRSDGEFRQAVELVRNGRVGRVHTVEVGLPGGGPGPVGGFTGTPPPNLDYDFWLGPAPWKPYNPKMIHWDWRWNLDTGGGQLMDWIGHHNDIAHWGMGYDRTGPVEIEAVGEYPKTGIWTGAIKYRINCVYPDGVRSVIAGGHNDIRGGTKWIGTHGWVWVNRGQIDAEPKTLLQERIGPDEIQIPPSPGHQRNFLDSVKSRRPTLCTAETGHRSITPGHLGQIAMLLGGRKLRWDPVKEQIIGDPEASRMLGYEMRSPWTLG